MREFENAIIIQNEDLEPLNAEGIEQMNEWTFE